MLPDNTAYELAQHLAREEENDRRAEERQAMIEECAQELFICLETYRREFA